VALTPTKVLFLLIFVTVAGVVVITVNPGDSDVMNRPPRDPKIPITNMTAVLFWILYGAVVFLASLVPLVTGPDEPSVDQASVFMTMTFVMMGFGTVFTLTNRRDPTSGLTAPILQALAISLVPVALIVLRPSYPVCRPDCSQPHSAACSGWNAWAGTGAAAGRRGQQMDPPSLVRPVVLIDAQRVTRRRSRRRRPTCTNMLAPNLRELRTCPRRASGRPVGVAGQAGPQGLRGRAGDIACRTDGHAGPQQKDSGFVVAGRSDPWWRRPFPVAPPSR